MVFRRRRRNPGPWREAVAVIYGLHFTGKAYSIEGRHLLRAEGARVEVPANTTTTTCIAMDEQCGGMGFVSMKSGCCGKLICQDSDVFFSR